MRKSNCIIILLLTLLFTTCNKKTPNENNNNSSSLQNNNSYIFYVDRAANHPSVQFPFDTLTEEQYSPDNTSKTYNVKFSIDGQQVFINNDSMQGTVSTETDLKKSYFLDKGVFAGGRFVIWPKTQPANAELTIYGSGVPIIVSERGRLGKK